MINISYIDSFINGECILGMSLSRADMSLEYCSAVSAGARWGLQAALIGPYGRILTIVYL